MTETCPANGFGSCNNLVTHPCSGIINRKIFLYGKGWDAECSNQAESHQALWSYQNSPTSTEWSDSFANQDNSVKKTIQAFSLYPAPVSCLQISYILKKHYKSTSTTLKFYLTNNCIKLKYPLAHHEYLTDSSAESTAKLSPREAVTLLLDGVYHIINYK